ncbi:MAG: response regulator [Bacteroidetes bacterium]|jgi:signal transduction histidine kinase/ligand-binding sensor domain-containing protein/DNA-binding response OmpR family regulator|nr:response regulator [Bacteroidota bacterium]
MHRLWLFLIGWSALVVFAGSIQGPLQSAAAQGLGQDERPYVHDTWRTEDGLPHNSVAALVQTRDGYLWLGTAAGLVRFDGLAFTVLADPAHAHLSHSYVWTLHEDAEGALWIGTSDGLTRRTEDRLTTFTREDGLPSSFVRTLAQDRDGTLWVGMYGGGLCRYADDAAPRRFICYDTSDGLPDLFVNVLWVDRGGTVWVGTDTGLSRWDGQRFAAAPSVRSDVKALVDDADGALWVGTGDGLYRLRDGEAVPLRFEGRALGAVRVLREGPQGALWIGTEASGLYRWQDGHVRRFQADDGLSHGDVRALLHDREGNLWVGTNGGGLNRLKRSRVRTYAAEDGLPSDVVNAVLEDRQGRVWLATSGGLARLADGQIRVFDEGDGLPDPRVFSLAEDADGHLWAGTNGGGLTRYDGDGFTTFTTADGLPSDVIFSLFVDSRGRLWVGGQGLSRWDGDRFTTFTREDGLAPGLIVTMAEDADGTLWVGSDNGGLTRYDGEGFTTFTTADGLPTNAIRALLPDRDGTLWIGTRGGGLVRFRDGTFVTFTTRHGLPDDILYRILEDEHGHLWINTARRGIFRVLKSDLEAVARGRAGRILPLPLSRSDGLRSVEGVGGFHPAGWVARDGRLWFPTHQGVAVIDPDQIQRDPTPPPVHIEAVLLDEERIRLRGDTLDLPPTVDRIEIRYTGLSFSDPERVRFRHYLDGEEDGWTYAGTRRSRTYNNLPPGHYTFRVAAASPDGVWNSNAAALHLNVIPPWWRTPWAYLLYGLLGSAGLYGFVRWRVWALRQRNLELEALVDERTTQVQAQAEQLREMDRAKSRFFANLSHEFRTPLTLILGPLDALLDRTDDEADRTLLTGMRQQSQRLLRLINQLLDLSKLDAGRMPLRAERLDLAAFLRRLTISFQALAETEGVMLSMHAATDRLDLAADPEKLEHVFSNLLSNALKFTPDGGKVQVHLDTDDQQAEVRVRDTGPGIPEDELPHVFDRFYQAEAATGSGTLGSGIGLALARELVRLHGGTLRAESVVGFGSTFIVRLPLTLEPTEDAAPPAEAEREEPIPPPVPGDGHARAPVVTKADDEAVSDRDAAPDDAPLVLLVEDNADVRAFLKQTLRPRYRIAEAETGEDGLAQARDTTPALIISDVMMPGMDGLDLCRQLRADDALSAVPVILLTARVSEESRLEGLDAGADAYLAKPFSAAELLARAENLIQIRRHLRQRFSQEVVVQPTQVTVSSADAAFLEDVRAVVEDHLGDTTFSVEHLADAMHLSRRQLHRKLQALTDLSTVGFIRMMRLERAAQLLEQQAGNVSEIAYAVGFQDASYFSRVFRQAYGQTPSDYMAAAARTDRSDPATDRS